MLGGILSPTAELSGLLADSSTSLEDVRVLGELSYPSAGEAPPQRRARDAKSASHYIPRWPQYFKSKFGKKLDVKY